MLDSLTFTGWVLSTSAVPFGTTQAGGPPALDDCLARLAGRVDGELDGREACLAPAAVRALAALLPSPSPSRVVSAVVPGAGSATAPVSEAAAVAEVEPLAGSVTGRVGLAPALSGHSPEAGVTSGPSTNAFSAERASHNNAAVTPSHRTIRISRLTHSRLPVGVPGHPTNVSEWLLGAFHAVDYPPTGSGAATS